MPRKRKQTGLFKVILIVVLLGILGAGALRITQEVRGRLNARVEAAALENLERAQSLVQNGDVAEAERLLQPILDRVNDPAIAPRALMLRAELDEKRGDMAGAAEFMRRAAEDYPSSPDRPQAALKYARMLEAQGKVNEAFAIYDDVSKTAPPSLRAPALLALASQREAAGDKEGAFEVYRQVMRDAELHSEDWFQAAHAYGKINVARIFSPEMQPESKIYRVQSGDTIYGIGMKLNTTQALLTRANNLEENPRLHVNMNLKYTPKEFELVIERSTLRLYLLDKSGIFAVYRVGLGKPGNDTTLGRYRIGNKTKDPTWYKPGFGPIAAGSPENELGSRWMPLIPEVEGLPTDLGIHGTIKPESIGHYTSMGCPRLLNEEVEELYDLVVRSTPVTIVDRWEPENLDGREG